MTQETNDVGTKILAAALDDLDKFTTRLLSLVERWSSGVYSLDLRIETDQLKREAVEKAAKTRNSPAVFVGGPLHGRLAFVPPVPQVVFESLAEPVPLSPEGVEPGEPGTPGTVKTEKLLYMRDDSAQGVVRIYRFCDPLASPFGVTQ